MNSPPSKNEPGEFVISSCFYRGFYFSVYWNSSSVKILFAGLKDQTSRVNEIALTLQNEVLIKKINKCDRFVSLLDSFMRGIEFC